MSRTEIKRMYRSLVNELGQKPEVASDIIIEHLREIEREKARNVK